MTTSRNPVHKTLRIIVHGDNNNGEKKGTFTGPAPKMRVTTYDQVRWTVQVVPNDPNATFVVTFPGPSSPFRDAMGNPVLTVTDTNEREVVAEGLFHYQVDVTSGPDHFSIGHCPELDVDGNPSP